MILRICLYDFKQNLFKNKCISEVPKKAAHVQNKEKTICHSKCSKMFLIVSLLSPPPTLHGEKGEEEKTGRACISKSLPISHLCADIRHSAKFICFQKFQDRSLLRLLVGSDFLKKCLLTLEQSLIFHKNSGLQFL